MASYDDLLKNVQKLTQDAYHANRNPSDPYRGTDHVYYEPDEIDGAVECALHALLMEIVRRFDAEAMYASRAAHGPADNHKVLTWSLAASMVEEFSRNFEFSDSPELRAASTWWKHRKASPHFIYDASSGTVHTLVQRNPEIPAGSSREDAVRDDTVRDLNLTLLGARIRTARRRIGLTKADLAQRLQITRKEVSVLERGECRTLDGIRLDSKHGGLRWVAYHLRIPTETLLVFDDTDTVG